MGITDSSRSGWHLSKAGLLPSLTVMGALIVGPVLAGPASAAVPASASATASTARPEGVPTKRDKPSSRALPKAGGPAASQRYARAYISQRYGWGAGQFSCLRALWTKESGWRYWVSNPNGKYHGIPQTSYREWRKDGYTTSQYMHSPAIQIRVGTRYIKSRYGTPCSAWAHWRGHNWY